MINTNGVLDKLLMQIRSYSVVVGVALPGSHVYKALLVLKDVESTHFVRLMTFVFVYISITKVINVTLQATVRIIKYAQNVVARVDRAV